MRNLITGGAGFIGSYLAERLLNQGEDVVICDNLSTGRKKNIEHLLHRSNYNFIKADVTDRHMMKSLIAECDRLYHLAAPVGVKLIMEHPIHSTLSSIRAIDVILSHADLYKVQTFVASSSEIYGLNLDFLDENGNGKLSETAYRLHGSTKNHRWAYANTKCLSEFVAFAYSKKRGLPIVIGRLFNTVGPRQVSQYGMVIPTFVEQALSNQPITIYGEGNQSRSFIHVEDSTRAIVMLMNNPKAIGEEFNIGSEEAITINGLANRIKIMCHSQSPIKHIPYEEVYGAGYEDMQRRTPSIEKLRRYTGFQLEYDLDGILRSVISYFKQNKGL